MMEMLHYVLILLQLIVIILLLSFSLQLFINNSKGVKEVKEVTKEEYEKWKRENDVR